MTKERDQLKSHLNEIQSKSKRLVEALESGDVSIDRIKDRLKELDVEEKKQLLQLLIKQITYHKDNIKIDLYEETHIGLNISQSRVLDMSKNWLLRLDSNQ